MRTIKLFFLLALPFFACANLYAQVTIGSTNPPKEGAILDLNNGAKGGLVLSNVAITNPGEIPGHFPGMNEIEDLAVAKQNLKGAIIYNTDANICMGVHVWDGIRWKRLGTNDDLAPAGEHEVKITEIAEDIFNFTVESSTNAKLYNWYAKIGDGAYECIGSTTEPSFSKEFPAGNFKVKVVLDIDCRTQEKTANEASVITGVSPYFGNVAGENYIYVSGEFPYASTDQYVPGGLVAFFDAINNTGEGDRRHSMTATTWKNLADDLRPGLGTDALLKGFTMDGASNPNTISGWRSNKLYFDGADDYGVFKNPLFQAVGDDPELTVELVMMKDASSNTVYGNALDVGGTRINSWMSYSFWTTPIGTSSSRRMEVTAFSCNANQSGAGTSVNVSSWSPDNKCRTIANFDETKHPFTQINYNNGNPVTDVVLPNTYLVASLTLRMGEAYTYGTINSSSITHDGNYTWAWFNNGISLGGYTYPDAATIDPGFTIDYSIIGSSFSSNDTVAPPAMESNGIYDLKGAIYSIRYYNRALDSMEIAQNSELDKIRYLDPPVVTIGDTPCTDVAVLSSNFLICKVPPGVIGSKTVSVKSQDGLTTYANINDGYTYVGDNDFYIGNISPTTGSDGELLTLSGNKLDEIEGIKVGTGICERQSQNNASYQCTLPPNSPGEVDIMITVKDGTIYRFAKVFLYE
jgi:hypothetical protein